MEKMESSNRRGRRILLTNEVVPFPTLASTACWVKFSVNRRQCVSTTLEVGLGLSTTICNYRDVADEIDSAVRRLLPNRMVRTQTTQVTWYPKSEFIFVGVSPDNLWHRSNSLGINLIWQHKNSGIDSRPDLFFFEGLIVEKQLLQIPQMFFYVKK